MPRIFIKYFFLVVLLFPATFLQAKTDGLSEDEIDSLVTKAMKTFKVAGVSIGIVKDGTLQYAKGYGVRNINKKEKVDANTLFGIASNTKGFTTAALAILVDEGKINWDDKVVKHIPEFQMYDAYVTQELTIRDLLTHRTGLPLGAGDLMWWPNGNFTPKEVIARIKYLKPETSFRTKYSYNNMMYVVAGEIVARVSGDSWAQFIEQRLLKPLDMRLCAALRDRATSNNIANPHAVVDGKITAMHVAGNDFKAAEAAAGIVCNVSSLAKWMTMHLAYGKLNDETNLISKRQHKELWEAQIAQPVSDYATQLNRTHFRAYGLGFQLQDYFGYKRVSHGGALPGMITSINMIPELNLGVVVLTNDLSGSAASAISNSILMSYVDAEAIDQVDLFKQYSEQANDYYSKIEEAIWKTARKSKKPALSLSQYVGTYRDQWRGDVMVTKKNRKLILKFSRTDLLEGKLSHYKNGVFIVRWNDRTRFADAFVNFEKNFKGEINRMTMKAMLPSIDFSYDFHHLDLKKVSVDK